MNSLSRRTFLKITDIAADHVRTAEEIMVRRIQTEGEARTPHT
jgi:hypothetical protein